MANSENLVDVRTTLETDIRDVRMPDGLLRHAINLALLGFSAETAEKLAMRGEEARLKEFLREVKRLSVYTERRPKADTARPSGEVRSASRSCHARAE